jgi:uncharacterized protein (DUF433 family)
MSTEIEVLQERLNEALSRIQRLEERVATEDPAPRWRYLVERSHPWRRQLSIKGRNTTVVQLISAVRANGLSPEQASEDLGLPLQAVQEALAYYDENRTLIELEASEERRRLAERGHRLEPERLSR